MQIAQCCQHNAIGIKVNKTSGKCQWKLQNVSYGATAWRNIFKWILLSANQVRNIFYFVDS